MGPPLPPPAWPSGLCCHPYPDGSSRKGVCDPEAIPSSPPHPGSRASSSARWRHVELQCKLGFQGCLSSCPFPTSARLPGWRGVRWERRQAEKVGETSMVGTAWEPRALAGTLPDMPLETSAPCCLRASPSPGWAGVLLASSRPCGRTWRMQGLQLAYGVLLTGSTLQGFVRTCGCCRLPDCSESCYTDVGSVPGVCLWEDTCQGALSPGRDPGAHPLPKGSSGVLQDGEMPPCQWRCGLPNSGWRTKCIPTGTRNGCGSGGGCPGAPQVLWGMGLPRPVVKTFS